MSSEEVNKLKQAYWKLIEARNQLPTEYHEAMEVALNLLEKEMERKV